MNPDGSGFEEYANGVRNTVGFTWHPDTGDMWFTDNGRDSLGDDIPPDELNRAPTAGLNFGYPHCHGQNIKDPQYGTFNCNSSSFRKPARDLGPHVAALGLKFYTGSMFPASYKNTIFIAEHGSWNRSQKIGYRVSMVRPGAGGQMTYTPFAKGWLRADESRWGRPVDVLVMPDGALLVSDDAAGAVYRIWYEP